LYAYTFLTFCSCFCRIAYCCFHITKFTADVHNRRIYVPQMDICNVN